MQRWAWAGWAKAANLAEDDAQQVAVFAIFILSHRAEFSFGCLARRPPMSEATAEGGQSSIEDPRVTSGRLRESIRLGSGRLSRARVVPMLPRGRLGGAAIEFPRAGRANARQCMGGSRNSRPSPARTITVMVRGPRGKAESRQSTARLQT